MIEQERIEIKVIPKPDPPSIYIAGKCNSCGEAIVNLGRNIRCKCFRVRIPKQWLKK